MMQNPPLFKVGSRWTKMASFTLQLTHQLVVENEGSLVTEVHLKPTHTNQYLLFDSQHTLEHNLSVIRQTAPYARQREKKTNTHTSNRD